MAKHTRRGTPRDSEFFKLQLSKNGREILDKISDGPPLPEQHLVRNYTTRDYESVFRAARPSEVVLAVFWEWTGESLAALHVYWSSNLSWSELFAQGYRWGLKGQSIAVKDMAHLQRVLRQHRFIYDYLILYVVR